jgi:hypothetical protein
MRRHLPAIPSFRLTRTGKSRQQAFFLALLIYDGAVNSHSELLFFTEDRVAKTVVGGYSESGRKGLERIKLLAACIHE